MSYGVCYIKVLKYLFLTSSSFKGSSFNSILQLSYDKGEAMESRVAVLLLAVLPMVLAVPYWEDTLGGYPNTNSGGIQQAGGFPNNDDYQSEGDLIEGRVQQRTYVKYIFTETGPFRYDNIRNPISSAVRSNADYYFQDGKMFVRITLDREVEVSSVSVTVQGHNDGRYETFMSPIVVLRNHYRREIFRQTGVDTASGEDVQVTVPVSPRRYAAVVEAQIWQRGYGCPWDIIISFIC